MYEDGSKNSVFSAPIARRSSRGFVNLRREFDSRWGLSLLDGEVVTQLTVNQPTAGSNPALAATPVRSGNKRVSYSRKGGPTPLTGSMPRSSTG